MDINLIVTNPFLLVLLSVVLGIIVWFTCGHASGISKNCTSKTMQFSLMLLPALVTSALLAVNGSLGTSIAILGIFGLVRFRSTPGNAKDIVYVFYAMVTGLLVSTGYVFVSIIIVILLGIIILGATKFILSNSKEYQMKILIPEDMNFEEVIGNILGKYFERYRLDKVKTADMGTVFELNYIVTPRKDTDIKACLDEIRTHNGNMNIAYTVYNYNNEL